VQQVSAHGHAGSLGVIPGSAVTAGDRMVVEVGAWNTSGATASSVTDSAGNSYTELTHFTASDGTELSVWTAPLTAGAGTKPAITAKLTGAADIGVAAVEYAGLSAAAGAAVLDVQAHATGSGHTGRVNLAPTSDMELLVEDQTVGLGTTPAATAGTGPGTTWLMATLVLKHA
jgi:hypothetical protein